MKFEKIIELYGKDNNIILKENFKSIPNNIKNLPQQNKFKIIPIDINKGIPRNLLEGEDNLERTTNQI